MSALNPILAFAAGILSVLSPCVLPLLPIVFGGAASRHRWGPAALAAGLAVTFTTVGLLLATVGFALGLDADSVRKAGGVVIGLVGLVLVIPTFGAKVAGASAPVTNWGQQRLAGFDGSGLWGQAVLGSLLGLVWSPCVGPTLGAASVIAAQGHAFGQVAVVMLAFGLGAAGSLILIGYASQRSVAAWRGRIRSAGEIGRRLLGLMLLLIGFGILSGLDRSLETWLVQVSPAWLTRLTTHF